MDKVPDERLQELIEWACVVSDKNGHYAEWADRALTPAELAEICKELLAQRIRVRQIMSCLTDEP